MDHAALELLFQTAIGDYNGKQARLEGTDTIALPANFSIIDLEKFKANRKRFRGSLQTNSLADFIAYVIRNADTITEAAKDVGGTALQAHGFIDAKKLSATALFNLGTIDKPGHGDWFATLSMEKTAAFAALTGADGKVFDQQTLIDFVEDWSPFIGFRTQTGEAMPTAIAITALRKINIKTTSNTETTQENFSGAVSSLDKVEASSQVGLPEGFSFTTEPYLGLPSRTFQVRLGIRTDSEKPKLTLRIQQREAEEEAIAQDFKQVLQAGLEEKAVLTIGTFKL